MRPPAKRPANLKVVLVTGASSGIGQSIARRLAAMMARVLGDPRSAMRYSVGMWDRRLVLSLKGWLPLKRWLPFAWFERIVGGAMGI